MLKDFEKYFANLDEKIKIKLLELYLFVKKEFSKYETEEVINYGIPTFKINKKSIVGIGAFKKHISFFPYSGSILEKYKGEIKDFEYTKSSLHIKLEQKIPKVLIKKIIKERIKFYE